MKSKKALDGFTMIEMIISVGMLSIITVITMTIFLSLNNSFSSNNLYNVMKIYDQAGINKLGNDITTSRIIIGRNKNEAIGATGTYSSNFIDNINSSPPFNGTPFETTNKKKFKPTLAANRILPVVDKSVDLSVISSSPANASVGNSFLTGIFDDSTIISWASTTAPSCACNRTASIDLIVIKYYFLANDSQNKLFLICGSSKYYADHTQINGLLGKIDNDAERGNLMSALRATTLKSQTNKKPITIEGIWKSDDKTTNITTYMNFYTLNLDTTTAPDSLKNVVSTYKIPMEYFTMYNNQVLENYSISKNNLETDASRKVPLMAAVSTSGDGYPNGFEIAITGESGAREVFIRLVSEAIVANRKIFNQTTITATGKDSG